MKRQANKTASSGSSDKDSSAESSAPEEGETHPLVRLGRHRVGKKGGPCYIMACAFRAVVLSFFSGLSLIENMNEAGKMCAIAKGW
jgi:hypothetical protein